MVSIEEQISNARQELREGREQLDTRERELTEFRRETETIRAPRRSVSFQLTQLGPARREIEQAGGIERISGRIRQERTTRQGIAKQQGQRIESARKEISSREQELNRIEREVQKARREEDRDRRRQERRARRNNIRVVPDFIPAQRTQREKDIERLSITARAKLTPIRLNKRSEPKKKAREPIRLQKTENFLTQVVSRGLTTFPVPTTRQPPKQFKSFARGFVRPIVGTVEFGANLVTRPISTTKETGAGALQLGKNIKSGEAFRKIVRFAKEDPSGFAGRVAGEVVTFRASSFATAKAGGVFSGAVARTGITGKFNSVRVRELPTGAKEKFIPSAIGDIGLIPEGKGARFSPTDPATVRGAFGFSQKEQEAFRGVQGISTSQRGFLGRFSGKGKIRDRPPPEQGQGLFGTPADPRTGQLQTRVSRLGESPRSAGITDIIRGNVSFRRQGQPQIIVFPKERAGSKGGFQGFTSSSELEVVTRSPSTGGPLEVRRTKKVGVTVIGGAFGRRVPIVEAEFFPARGATRATAKNFGTRATQRTARASQLINTRPRFPTTAITSRLVRPTRGTPTSRAVGPSRGLGISTRPLSRPPRGSSIIRPPPRGPPSRRPPSPPRGPPTRGPPSNFRFGGVPALPTPPPRRPKPFGPALITPRGRSSITLKRVRGRRGPIRQPEAIRPSFTGAIRFNVLGVRGQLKPQLGSTGFLPTVRPVPLRVRF